MKWSKKDNRMVTPAIWRSVLFGFMSVPDPNLKCIYLALHRENPYELRVHPFGAN